MSGIWIVLFVVQWSVVLLLALIIIGVLRYLAKIQGRIDLAVPPISSFELNDPIPGFELPSLAGAPVSVPMPPSRAGETILLFMTATCRSCRLLAQQLQELVDRNTRWDHLGREVIVVVAGSPQGEMRDQLAAISQGGVLVLTDADGATLTRFGIRSAPTGLTVDARGRVKAQSWNPHAADWLHQQIGVPGPAVRAAVGRESLVVPAAELASRRP